MAQRNGDFSQTFAQNGQLIRVFDPFTTRPNPSGSGFIRDQFPGNVIPVESDGSGGAPGPQLLSAAEPTGQRRSPARRTTSPPAPRELNVDNIDGRVDHNISEKARGVHPLLLPQDVQLAGDVLPRGHRRRRRARQRAEPRPQRRHRLQPDDLEHDADERPARVRAHAVPLRQPGPRLQAVEPRPADVDRFGRRSRDVPAVRRQRHDDARRQRPSLQRVHELHRSPPA